MKSIPPVTVTRSLAEILCACACTFLLACAPAPADGGSGGAPGGGTGGAATSSGGSSAGAGGASTSSGGSSAGTGGAASGGNGSGGASSGGRSGSGGAGTGGTAASGGRGGSTSSSGGAGGGTSATGGVGGTTAATPSAGCGKGGRPGSGVVTVAGEHIYNFPTSYDGMKPMPLVVGFHGAGNPIDQLQKITNGTRMEPSFVRAFPKSVGSGWVMGTDSPRVTTMLNDLFANYCIDTSRVFATGHSSGAQMVVQLLCASGGEKRFRAVAPVAASKYCAKVSPIGVMYIQGMMDMMRGDSNGIDVVNVFTSSNTCGTTTTPDTAVMGCNSTFDKMPVTPGCVTYQGCMQPTIWCSHNDNGYNGTDGNMHGWPCFASNAMADFFLGF